MCKNPHKEYTYTLKKKENAYWELKKKKKNLYKV